jgi:uncharacterized protein (DUF849 family)
LPLLEAALNGSREHPAVPRTPAQLARDAKACVKAGARVLHIHAFEAGAQTLAPGPCAAAVQAVHLACPGIPVSLTTFAEIEPDPRRRLRMIRSWSVLPELVTANQGEEGIVELSEYLIGRGVGIEAGILTVEDAQAFVRTGLADRCVRVLFEPLDADPAKAVAHADAMERTLSDAGISLERVFHGDGMASWAVNRRGLQHGHGIRTGLEDTHLLPDGSVARDNESLVKAASDLAKRLQK